MSLSWIIVIEIIKLPNIAIHGGGGGGGGGGGCHTPAPTSGRCAGHPIEPPAVTSND